ncbi:Fe-S cluster assembly protein SufB [Bradyrhizobium sp. JR6.1]
MMKTLSAAAAFWIRLLVLSLAGPELAVTCAIRSERARRNHRRRELFLRERSGQLVAIQETVERVRRIDVDQYRYGFETLIESDKAPKGLSEDTVRFISGKKNEPAWMLEWRLEAYRRWLTMTEPTWARVNYPKIDYQDLYYYSAPKPKKTLSSIDEIDPEILKTYEKLGIPLREVAILEGVEPPPGGPPSPNRKIAVDAVFDSVSVATTFQKELKAAGVIFMPISEAIREHPDLVQKYLGTVVPTSDNYFATLNSAVFSDGSFVYVPPGVRCPMELSTYFRINERNTGQFERTLIIADKGSYVSYLEGCTAPQRDENQLHAAVVELVTLDDAEIKYSTVQNWYPGNSEGKGGIYNFVTKRGDCRGRNSKISWTQVETGSAITWKYPSCILRGDNSSGEFYSIAISNGFQQVDSGTKMIHLGKNTSSRIISKGIAAGKSQNTYRGLVSAHRKATGARNYTACDSLLIGDKCGAHTVPYVEAKNSSATFEHEATTSKISEDVLFYCIQRGLSQEEAVGLVVNGFVKDVLQQLPMEFAVEAQKLISISLEGSVG